MPCTPAAVIECVSTDNDSLLEFAINTLTYFATVSEVRFEEGFQSAYVNSNFRVGYKNFATTALIDIGNNFGSCVLETFALNLGFSPDLPAPSPTRLVKQAGAGAVLKVIGLLPTHEISNCFKMENCPFQFPFYNIFVIKGLNQNVNISLPFLQKYKFIIDLDRNCLQFNQDVQEFNIPFILLNSTRISMTESTAELPKSGISVPPGQEILVQTI